MVMAPPVMVMAPEELVSVERAMATAMAYSARAWTSMARAMSAHASMSGVAPRVLLSRANAMRYRRSPGSSAARRIGVRYKGHDGGY